MFTEQSKQKLTQKLIQSLYAPYTFPHKYYSFQGNQTKKTLICCSNSTDFNQILYCEYLLVCPVGSMLFKRESNVHNSQTYSLASIKNKRLRILCYAYNSHETLLQTIPPKKLGLETSKHISSSFMLM